MPTCEFEASGEDFDVNAFLVQSSLPPCTPFHRGEDDPVNNHDTYPDSGFTFAIGGGDGEAGKENIAQVVNFLTLHEAELRRLQNFSGVTYRCLRFRYHVPRDRMLGEHLPSELIRLAGSLGLAIYLIMY